MAGPAQRIVIFPPNPIGDAVMFTPALRAIRARFPDAEIALFARPAPAETLNPNPWTRHVLVAPRSLLAAARALRRERFDLGVLAPNSFRSALTARLGGVRRRVGYDRDARGRLLTDRVPPPRGPDGRLAVVPAIDYYLRLAAAVGAETSDRRMELDVAAADAALAEELLVEAGLDPSRPLVVLNPGASYGPSKMYPAERFAAVGDALARGRGAQIVVNAGPGEVAVAETVERAMAEGVLLNLARVGTTLGVVKALLARAWVVITNDTGPRHLAAALGAGVVTIFGATDPDRTTIDYARERIVRVDVPCAPCQKKRCPLPPGPSHHQCMLSIPPEMVVSAAEELLSDGRPS